LADFSQINAELALFDPQLPRKPQLVAVNKQDQPEAAERFAAIRRAMKKRGVQVMPVSALARTNVRELLLSAAGRLAETPPLEDVTLPMPVYRPKEDVRDFTVKREGTHEWRLSGTAIERAAKMTFFEHAGALRRFQRMMEALGVDEALRKAGVQEGDTVRIGDYELEWQE
jgi:GTP-binding protein